MRRERGNHRGRFLWTQIRAKLSRSLFNRGQRVNNLVRLGPRKERFAEWVFGTLRNESVFEWRHVLLDSGEAGSGRTVRQLSRSVKRDIKMYDSRLLVVNSIMLTRLGTRAAAAAVLLLGFLKALFLGLEKLPHSRT